MVFASSVPSAQVSQETVDKVKQFNDLVRNLAEVQKAISVANATTEVEFKGKKYLLIELILKKQMYESSPATAQCLNFIMNAAKDIKGWFREWMDQNRSINGADFEEISFD